MGVSVGKAGVGVSVGPAGDAQAESPRVKLNKKSESKLYRMRGNIAPIIPIQNKNLAKVSQEKPSQGSIPNRSV